jgi:hypothetical protein
MQNVSKRLLASSCVKNQNCKALANKWRRQTHKQAGKGKPKPRRSKASTEPAQSKRRSSTAHSREAAKAQAGQAGHKQHINNTEDI